MRQADRQHEDDAGGEASGGDEVRMEVKAPCAKYFARPRRVLTNAGELPEDWHVQPLGALMCLLNGRAFSPNEWSDAGAPIIRIQNLNDPNSEFNFFSGVADERNLIRSGDLLFAWSGTTGSSFGARIWTGPTGVLNQHIFKVLPDPEKLSPAYAYRLLLKAQHAIERQAHGFKASFVHVKKSDLITVDAGFPPTLYEQDQISGALTDADALIDSLEQLLTKKRQIKQGAMQELLIGKRRLPGFSRPWAAVRLGDIGRTYGGLTGKSKVDFGHGSAKYVTFMNVMTNVTMTLDQVERVDIGPAESQNRVQPGDLLFNGSSETPEEVAFCSRVQACNEDVYLNSFCFGFRPSGTASISELFMAYFFRARPGRLAVSSLAQGATRYNISKAALLQAPLTLPDVMEQHAIAETLSVLDSEMTALEARLTKARALKQAMAQALLTGRIRLVARAA